MEEIKIHNTHTIITHQVRIFTGLDRNDLKVIIKTI